MVEIYAKEVIAWWRSQIGYKSGKSKSSKYSQMLDGTSPQWYNTKKNGYSDWCTIFYDAGLHACASGDNINEQRAIACEHNVDNCGAGCVQKWNYYAEQGRLFTKTKDAESGDQIFFRADKYVKSSNPHGLYHCGAILTWSDNKFYVAEGNTNGCGEVSERVYSFGDPRIAGFGRPKWTGWERPSPNPSPEPTPDPTPEPTPDPEPTPAPTPAPQSKDYRMVKVNTVLNVRSGPGTNYSIVQQFANGYLVNVSETKGSWAKIGDNKWVCADYLVKVTVENRIVKVNTFLNVRSGPGTEYTAVGRLYNGTGVTVYNRSGSWGQIGVKQWVSTNYLV